MAAQPDPAKVLRGNAKKVFKLVKENPGITIPELAERMGVKQNLLYRILPGLASEGLVEKKGARKWYLLGEGKKKSSKSKTVAAPKRAGHGAESRGTVLQQWVEQLPWKQQSILFSGLRGPDFGKQPAAKAIGRWMRSVSQENADPTKEYMDLSATLPTPKELADELEFLPCHFVHHLADSLAVIAYGHPDDKVRGYAYQAHVYIAEELFHFVPEQPEIFRWRHRDKPDKIDPAPEPPFDDRPWIHSLLPNGWKHP